jgi:hypothetical protein
MIRQFQVVGLALCAVLFFSVDAKAQGIRSATEEAREGEEIRGNTGVAEIAEVERGVFVGVELGGNYYIPIGTGAGFVPLNESFDAPGTRMGMRVGYDVSELINVEVFVLANFNKGPIKQDAIVAGNVTGDLAHFAPGIAGRFSFLKTDRLHTYVRGGAGYAMWFPAELGGAFGSIHLEGGLGVEYYTRLRHISIGAEVMAQALVGPTAVGVHVYPTIKYTF